MKQNFTKKQGVKNYSKFILPILVCVAMVYTSCRKVETTAPSNAAAQAASNEAVSSQIAVNLAQSLAGSYGGVNVHDRVDSVSLSAHNEPKQVFNPSALCGFASDSTINYTWKKGDTTTQTTGNAKFYFNCKNGKSTGYTAYDSLITVKTTPQKVYTYNTKQYYTIKCLDDNKFNGVDGEIDFTNSILCSCSNSIVNIVNANYILSNLTIDLCHNDILSGTATFKAYGTNQGQNWTLAGSVTFLGNHMADVLIDNKVYHVNVLTGKIVK
jgi:hypothetical protein